MAANELVPGWVDDIPVLWAMPGPATANGRLAVWLHHLTGTKEAVGEHLRLLAAAGFVAVSLDAWQHGERGHEDTGQLMARAFGSFRREVWPILGHTTLDALRVVDHALATYDLSDDVVAGGVSLGGDIAVALAGIDPRISRVAAIVATPDWTRPGMTVLDDPGTVVEQGAATPYGQWLYDRLDPLTHLDSFARGPMIAFELGGDDLHVSRKNALGFRAALSVVHPAAGNRVGVRLHPGLDHLAAARSPEVRDAALEWLTRSS